MDRKEIVEKGDSQVIARVKIILRKPSYVSLYNSGPWLVESATLFMLNISVSYSAYDLHANTQ